ncbi:YppE family protein [Bacillus salitolerans]|uniref:YppE family protein n=1 Tax=Bacillus salitolerans TaxID=1437434 RepID=A0ABW4LVI7_9BACI
MDNNQLYLDTKQLIQYNQKLSEIFTQIKTANEPADFFGVVKPTADEIWQVLDRWKPQVLDWIKIEKPKYFHPNQIESTCENIQAVSVQAFFPDTKEKRFKELIRSNKYIFDTLIELLEKQEKSQ